jgi:tRNA(Ile)-lysidine synthase
MLHVMAKLAEPRGLVLFAHGVDHGLRAEATAELDLAEQLATTLGVPFSRSSVTLSPGGNTQAKARQLRYEALRKRASELGGALIATAHHANDRAETVLLRILRGTGLDGLGVLAPIEGDLLRPLLRATRSDVTVHLTRHGLPFATDPSNSKTKYARVKVRLEVLPLLESMSPNIVQQLCQLADEACVRRPEAQQDSLSTLGRNQRVALERAIALGQVGFELPLSSALCLVLEGRRS